MNTQKTSKILVPIDMPDTVNVLGSEGPIDREAWLDMVGEARNSDFLEFSY